VLAPQRGAILLPIPEKGINLLSILFQLQEEGEGGMVYALMPCEGA
jgi:hypothetical protein